MLKIIKAIGLSGILMVFCAMFISANINPLDIYLNAEITIRGLFFIEWVIFIMPIYMVLNLKK